MDENKLKRLKEIDYTIGKCCGMCDQGRFGFDDWGTCNLWNYTHIKHSDEKRQLSIHKFGFCKEFHYNLRKKGLFGKFIEFLRE